MARVMQLNRLWFAFFATTQGGDVTAVAATRVRSSRLRPAPLRLRACRACRVVSAAFSQDSAWTTWSALLDFAERSQVQREPRSARNPLSLKAVLPTDRCKATERRKTIKHVIGLQALSFPRA